MKYFSLQRIKKVITQADTPPHITAISMAVGVSLAFGPLPGLHLVLGFLINRIFRLNPVVMLVGILAHNPWTMIPIHLTGLFTGDLILYQKLVSAGQFESMPWDQIGVFSFVDSAFWAEHGQTLASFLTPFVVGHLILSTTTGIISYKLTHMLARRYQK